MSDTENRADRRHNLLHAMNLGPLWVERRESSEQKNADVQIALIAEAESNLLAKQSDPGALQKQAPSAWDAPAIAAQPPSISSTASTATSPLAKTADIPESANSVDAANIAEMDWDALQSAVAACTRCPMCRSRNRTVFGIGDRRARWLLIGEGPGRNEDQQGEPFVGPAGKLLDNMLHAIDLKRGENNYVANVVKCRPTDANGRDRAPTADEIAACRPYLERQIALVKPTMIVAFGKVAALSLLGSDPKTALSSLRGIVHQRNHIPLVVTYHPAYLLRKPLDKAMSWQDLCLARQASEQADTLAD